MDAYQTNTPLTELEKTELEALTGVEIETLYKRLERFAEFLTANGKSLYQVLINLLRPIDLNIDENSLKALEGVASACHGANRGHSNDFKVFVDRHSRRRKKARR